MAGLMLPKPVATAIEGSLNIDKTRTEVEENQKPEVFSRRRKHSVIPHPGRLALCATCWRNPDMPEIQLKPKWL